MAECNANDLLSAGRDFGSLSEQQLLAIQVQLLCEIANGAGGGITGFTPGSMVYIGSDGKAAENNAEMFWDTTNLRLRIGDRTQDMSLISTYKPKMNVTNVTTGAVTGIFPALIAQTIVKHNVSSAAHGLTAVVQLNDAAAVCPGILGFNGVVIATAGTASTQVTGGALNASIQGATAGNVYGGQLVASILSGTINNTLHGALINPIIAGGTITQDVIGVRIVPQFVAGTVSRDLYLLHMAPSGTGTTISGSKWGMYLDCVGHPTMVGVFVKGAATHTGNLFEMRDSGNTLLSRFDSGANLIMGSALHISLGNTAVAETPSPTHTVQIKDFTGTVYKLICTT